MTCHHARRCALLPFACGPGWSAVRSASPSSIQPRMRRAGGPGARTAGAATPAWASAGTSAEASRLGSVVTDDVRSDITGRVLLAGSAGPSDPAGRRDVPPPLQQSAGKLPGAPAFTRSSRAPCRSLRHLHDCDLDHGNPSGMEPVPHARFREQVLRTRRVVLELAPQVLHVLP